MIIGLYLHILHGNNVHPTRGPSLHQLRAEVVHDNDGLENRAQAFLPVLQQRFHFARLVTNHSGDLG